MPGVKIYSARNSNTFNFSFKSLSEVFLPILFSEHKLTFTFAICCRPSVCRLSVVCNARAPYSAGWNFQERFFAIWYLSPIDIHGKFYGDRPRGTPAGGRVKRKRGSQI